MVRKMHNRQPKQAVFCSLCPIGFDDFDCPRIFVLYQITALGILRRLFSWIGSNISEEPTVCFFKVEHFLILLP